MRAWFTRALAALVVAQISTLSVALAAEPFPTRPVRIVVAAAPGGALDITTRLVAIKMSEKLGQTIIVENRAGGDTLLGTRVVRDAPPDGYTLLAQANAFTAMPALRLDPGYDPLTHFTAIGPMVRTAQVMYVGADQPDRGVADFIARARAQPGKLTYAHGGIGGPPHLGAAQFMHQASLDVQDVPYKGNGAAFPDVAAGRVVAIFGGYAGGAPYVQAGKLRPLGVTGTKRLAALPDVPTFQEQGVNYVYYFWLGLLAPAATPKDVVQRLSEALQYAISTKDLEQRFRGEGSEPMPATPDEFNKYLASEVQQTGRLIKELNISKE